MDLTKLLSKVSPRHPRPFVIFITLFSQYKNIQATKKDVMTALEQYRAITYRVDSYVFNDGSKKELLNLSGTIPVVYKSKDEFFHNILMIHRAICSEHLSYSDLYLADGHTSLQRADLLRQADARHAHQGFDVRRPQWKNLPSVSSRLAAKLERIAGPDSGDDCDVWRTSTSLLEAKAGNSLSSPARCFHATTARCRR